MKKKALSMFTLLLFALQGAWAYDWDGSGTAADPYLIKNELDWWQLYDASESETFSGVYFRQTRDISEIHSMVGTESSPFAGIYDGDGHSLDVSINSDGAFTAPFRYVGGATIRHLHIKGTITGKLHTSGLIGACQGGTNTIEDCHVSATITEKENTVLRAGGFIGHGSEAENRLSDCLFDGTFNVVTYVPDCYFAPFIGWSTFTTSDRQSITNCLENGNYVAPGKRQLYFAYSQSDNRTDNPITLDRCYSMQGMTVAQGIPVFDSVEVPEGCSYKFVSDPAVQFGGKSYWTTGATIDITVPEGTPFNHWSGPAYPGIFISDCFKASGRHTLEDVVGKPILTIQTNPIPEAETERTQWGVTYRWLSRGDYHFYFSDETVKARGWHFENGDVKTDDNTWDDNLLLYNADGNASELTVITGYDESDYNDDGVQIHNDLVGVWANHTHLAMIAPRAFNNSSALKTLYFKDTDANNYNTLTPFDFEIGNEAFANCPNLTEIKMMQYTTEGDNHWEKLDPWQVTKIGYDVFLGSPNAKVSTHREVYQQYLSSETWRPYRSRIIIYDATVADFTVEGVKYHKFRNADETKALSNNEKDQMMDNHVRIWNADYQQFNAASLLDTKDGATVYYTYVVGVDDDDIDDNDGVMRIYNDPGSYYNYKTLALGRTAIAGNEHVKAIEFYQSNGNSENSYSDLKFVIQDGALKGCTNLKELRMFYYVEEGTDHWETLGPEDVIPGDNIFGRPTIDELDAMSEEELRNAPGAPEGFKVLVATNRYQEFLSDPNWVRYLSYLEPVDFEPSGKKQDFTRGGLTYGYMTQPGGILQTSQVVSQDVSWWTAPRIIAEIALLVATWGASGAGSSATSAAAVTSEEILALQSLQATASTNFTLLNTFNVSYVLSNWAGTTLTEQGLMLEPTSYLFKKLVTNKIIDETGKFLMSESMSELEMFIVHNSLTQAFEESFTNVAFDILTKQAAMKAAAQAAAQAAQAAQAAMIKTLATGVAAAATTTSSYLASKCWGGTGAYNDDALLKGMRTNILSNIHQVGLVGGGYVVTTPSKNLIYHNYIKSVDDNLTDAIIYAGFDEDGNSTTSNITITFGKNAFKNKTNLRTVSFHANAGQTSNASMPMVLTIPDSAFVGCTALTELNLLLKDNEGGTRALGPENFVLAGDSIFAGLDSLQFHIVIDESRKQDFLDNESWEPLKKYFSYANAQPVTQYREYGANYAYAYEQNSIKKENKVLGHLIEHTIVTGMDTETNFIDEHQGAVKLCNDIGTYNNYQLDYVARKAFYGNNRLRTVSFTDLYGWGGIGDSYTGLDVTLQDSCFAYCPNLVNLDLVYMKTDGVNELQPLTPQQVKIGTGVLEGSPAKLKMMPQQVAWFEADSTWVKYKDRFMPCIIKPADAAVYAALKDMRYFDPANEGTDDKLWDDYIDLARIAGIGFSWLDNRFTNNGSIRSFPDFKQFESVGLDYVGGGWFNGCSSLSNIVLPSTIKRIEHDAMANCTSLTLLEIPASVEEIQTEAFLGCTTLYNIIVRGETPATLTGSNHFDTTALSHIYVPAASVETYKTAWSQYAQYIKSDADLHIYKTINMQRAGDLATELSLRGIYEDNKLRYLEGPYHLYDSLTINGPLNGDDIAVLRHLMGANAWDSDPTDGCLRYLNLWSARIEQDTENSYNGWGVDEYLEKANWIGEYMFHNCTALETLILPGSVTEIGENAFQDATALKRIAVGRSTKAYTRDLLQNLEGIEELVFFTDQYASSESSDPWEADIANAYVLQSQLGDYISDPALTRRAKNIMSLFEDEEVMWALAEAGNYFPSEFLQKDNADGLLSRFVAPRIKTFEEFAYFQNVKSLNAPFTYCTAMERITLPTSIEAISNEAFKKCTALKTIRIACDSVPTLGSYAFDTQVRYHGDNFRIYVPKELCKRYREAWPQYADYINVDNRRYTDEETITVTLTEENTLAQALGLTVTETVPWHHIGDYKWINSVKGNYSKVRRLKVVGPISGADISLLRYLAGFCPWTNSRNYAGKLEYIDLYDAQLKESYYLVASDMYNDFLITGNVSTSRLLYVEDDVLPAYSFLQAYNLKTLILPKTCKVVRSRALQQCEGLETLVIGDDIEEFNWDALNDDAMLTRLYILAKNKPEMTTENAVWRALCNNYNPTFDAFYVRPSLYQEYLRDDNYVSSSWQRTNNVSTGEFDEDDSFLAFASHGAATMDDLSNVTDVTGWFSGHEGIKDLTPLGYTIVDTLKTADLQPLTSLERVTLPATLTVAQDSLFRNATNLRYVDMLMCDSTNVIADVKTRGLSRLGIDPQQTLVYMPQTYGTSDGTNIVVASESGLTAKAFRLVDGKAYCVPYAFKTDSIVSSRTLAKKGSTYTVCLPYEAPKPANAKVYTLSDRNGDALVFNETTDETMAALTPYLVVPSVAGVSLTSNIEQAIPASAGLRVNDVTPTGDNVGFMLRGTLVPIENAEAHDIGAYIMQSDNRWYPTPANEPKARIPSFRAYLVEWGNTQGARPLSSLFDDTPSVPTDISHIRTVDKDGTERIYDLSGRRIDSTDGKSVIIKNGKKYVNK